MTVPEPSPPNRVPWPPLIYLGAVVAAVALYVALPLSFPDGWKALLALIGVACLAAGVTLDIAAIRTLGASRTTVRPDRPARNLVTDGPYRLSRNPIYLGNTVALIGLALVFDVPWFLVTAPLAALAVQELAIRREERHLAELFPEAWEAYASRVRRWF
jgi:protein-S-isoprenylcysteine O-methyltransferase Ste14